MRNLTGGLTMSIKNLKRAWVLITGGARRIIGTVIAWLLASAGMNIVIHDKWKGKWVLVTGGSDRVGKGICEYLAARGLNVIIHARTDRPSLHALAEALRRDYGVEVQTVTGELTNEAAVKAIFEQCSPDVVVNNAAVFEGGKNTGNIAANKDASLLVTREAIARAERDWKGIVIFFVGDSFAEKGGEYPGDHDEYLESKLWIREMVEKLASLGKKRIRVLAIMSGPIEPKTTTPVETVAKIRAEINMPEEELNPWIGGWRVGEAIYALLIAEAISGVVFVDGGRSATNPAPPEH